MNTFMQSHSHTLIMNFGWGIREYVSVNRCILYGFTCEMDFISPQVSESHSSRLLPYFTLQFTQSG